jgi:hypothetical protein
MSNAPARRGVFVWPSEIFDVQGTYCFPPNYGTWAEFHVIDFKALTADLT